MRCDEADGGHPMLEKTAFTCTANDGLVLQGMYWHDSAVEARAAVLFIHGMLEYYGRYDAYASFLAENGIRFFAFDLRGHGLTTPDDANRGFFGAKDGTGQLMADVAAVRVRMNEFLAGDGLSGLPVFLYGHSMGSFIASCYAKRTAAAGLSGILLSGTTADNKKAGLGVALARTQCLIRGPKSRGKFLQNMGFAGYNKRIKPARTIDDWLSRDEKIVDAYMADPGCTFVFKAAGMADLAALTRESGSRNWTGVVPKDVPVFIFAGEEDPVGEYGRGPKLLAKWFGETGHETSLKLYPSGRHEMHNELNREEVYKDVLSFILLHSQRSTPLDGALASGPGAL